MIIRYKKYKEFIMMLKE